MEETTRSQIDDNCNCEDHKCSNCNNTIDKLLAELTALRAWKEQRLKEDTKSYFKSLEENGQLGALIDNLNKLRAWKAKARPFLEEAVRTIHEYYHPAINPTIDDSIWEEERKDLEILTELLGGSDEN